MRLLIKPLIPSLRPASRLHLRLERWILNALKVNNPSKKMTKTPGTTKIISFLKIFLLMHHHVGLNPLWHSLRKTRTVIPTEKDPDNKAKAKIFLPLASTPPSSEKTKTKIRTKRTYPTLSATVVSKKIIMPISVLRRSQKTSVGFNNLHVDK